MSETDCVLKEFGNCSYSETGCSDCKVKAKIRNTLSVQPKPCEDAINRKDAIRWVKTECNPYGKPTLDFKSGKKVIEHLKRMPPAQLERPKGKWIWELDERDPGRNMMLVCSICGNRREEIGEYNFCNTCGAKMINPKGEAVNSLSPVQPESCEDTVSREEVNHDKRQILFFSWNI